MNKTSFQILIVDDEPLYAESILQILAVEGYEAQMAKNGEEALQILAWKKFDLVITDLMMPGLDGIGLLEKIKLENGRSTDVLLMTAYGTIPSAVKAIQGGALGYYVKGSDPAELIHEVDKAFQLAGHRVKNNLASGSIAQLMVSENDRFRQMVEMAKKAADSPVNIMLLGESGVGKDLFARYIHEMSPRSAAPFVAVNCQALSENVLESELFGHSKGAFTGALIDRMGRFETADRGTLFLDEVADIALSTQVKLLRVIENKSIERIGSNESRTVDFRLITATNKDMIAMIEKGQFREDFYYRLSTVVLEIPPLRSRKEDLPRLVDYFVKTACSAMNKEPLQIDEEVWAYLRQYDYPGNVRELKNIIDRLVVFSEKGVINSQHLFGYAKASPEEHVPFEDEEPQTLRDFRAAMERAYIIKMLEKNDRHLTETASVLGITRRQLFNKMKDLDIE